jgi:hypothetical protein
LAFAVFDMFFVLTGAVAVRLCAVIGLHLDAVSLAVWLFNFSVRARFLILCRLLIAVLCCVVLPHARKQTATRGPHPKPRNPII